MCTRRKLYITPFSLSVTEFFRPYFWINKKRWLFRRQYLTLRYNISSARAAFTIRARPNLFFKISDLALVNELGGQDYYFSAFEQENLKFLQRWWGSISRKIFEIFQNIHINEESFEIFRNIYISIKFWDLSKYSHLKNILRFFEILTFQENFAIFKGS